MTLDEVSRDFAKASAMMRALTPSVENAIQALSGFGRAFQSYTEATRNLLDFQAFSDLMQRARARRLDLRQQLKRKGKPGWKRMRMRHRRCRT